MRTTGSVETYADLNVKRDIEAGKLPGPHMDVTGPYLEGEDSFFIQMPRLNKPGGSATTGGILGRPRRNVVQSLHEHYTRGVEGRHL